MIKLYSYFRSSCSYRVRIALNLKNLAYETLPIHLVKDGGEQYSQDFKKLNPSSKVPVLIDGNQSFFQSVAIIEYLEDTQPDIPLYPNASNDKAQVRLLCEIINSDIQPLQNLRVLQSLVKNYGLDDGQKIGWIQKWISEGFQTYETELSKTAGEFSFKDQPGAADCFLVPQVYNALRFKIDLDAFPLISKVHKNCSEVEAFQKAHPDRQPDAPA